MPPLMDTTRFPGPSVKATLARLGLSPRKALGQHFLVSQGAVATILRAADIGPEDTVLEVGPGLGVMTSELVQRAKRVIAVELDQELAVALERELGAAKLKMVCADARQVDITELTGGEPYKLVANLPYYAASPILRRFLESAHPPTRAVVMVQREVARNMVAQPGDMSLMSVGIQLYGKPRIVKNVPPTSFYPPPKVTSAIVQIDVYPKPALVLDDIAAFFKVVRAGFCAPRKQLRNTLAQGLVIRVEEALALLEKASIDPARRPATLSLEEWGYVYRTVKANGVNVSTSPRQD
ncbi:MAG: 16S rRNA (adenine(1518)-N(6)/adenine(1519)-N(6))-dimethyltransferase RsmA [Dehalococcoidia bacterium]|nr:16S rRNA (adenine(1518)-N(6)/adenine(1519)-N(6))-dimethyltransferase RsmA [Dehalococcoidia bacterium]